MIEINRLNPFLRICKNLNIKPNNAMMIGDTISDVHAGINAKSVALLVFYLWL